MKKLLSFILLLMVPLIVTAEERNINDLTKKWESYDGYFFGTYITPNSLIKYNNDEYLSINVKTGKTTRIVTPYNRAYHYIYDDRALIMDTDANHHAKAVLYNDKLKEIKTTDLGNFDIENVIEYGDNNLLVSGRFTDNNDEYIHTVLIINNQGEILKQIQAKTFTKAALGYFNAIRIPFVVDDYSNMYEISNEGLIPVNMNADGTYTVLNDSKITNYSKNGTKVKEIILDDMKQAKIQKKGDKYYVDSAVYSTKAVNGRIITNFTIKLRVLDEELNILAEKEIVDDDYYIHGSPDITKPRSIHDFVLYNNELYLRVTGEGQTFYYTVSEDLTLTSTNTYYGWTNYDRRQWLYNKPVEYQILDNTIYERLGEINNVPDYNVKYRMDRNNIAALTLNKKTEDQNNYSKLELSYYDGNYNEIFKTIVYDWSIDYEGYPTFGKIGGFDVEIIDNYIFVLANCDTHNYFKVYDKNGNLVKDLSSEIANISLSVNRLLPTSNGIYLEFIRKEYDISSSEDGINNYIGEELDENKTYMVYYSFPYLVNTEKTGEGTVSVTPEKALEGETVTFIATPSEGYVLKELIVRDENGNRIEVINNSFIMPESDVTIEAVFVKADAAEENPNTQDIAIATIAIIAIATAGMYLINRKKMKEIS